MNRLFSTESAFYQALSQISSVIWVTFLWLLACIPGITIGASTAAYFRMLFDIHEGKSSTFLDFCKALISNFKKATGLWLIELLWATVLAGLYWAVLAVTVNVLRVMLLALFLALFFAWAMALIYGPPLLAYFENTLLGTLKNTFAMGTRHYRQTIFSLVLCMFPVLFLLFLPYWFLVFFPAVLIFGSAGIAYIIMLMMETVFANYTGE